MKRAPTIAVALAYMLLGGASASAQTAPPAEDSRDRIVAKGIGGGAADWEEEPWWMALADCAEAYRIAPNDREKAQTFGVAAAARLTADRAIPAREAAPMVIAYMRAQGHERAEVSVGLFGGPETIRSRCDKVLVQYRAL